MLKVTITIELEGKTQDDIDFGMDVAMELIQQGNNMGLDRNETGRYRFDVQTEGEEESEEDEENERSEDG